ncbi:MAG: PAS domain S-box protein [Sulfuricurvum sp.]|nr:PAS domain S-box protein [Sulfuricurvum sp.]
MIFLLNERILLLLILLFSAIVLSLYFAYKIKYLQKECDRLTKETKEEAKILFLQSRNASMGETVGNIAHQWKQPLNAIGSIQNSIKAALIFQGEISKEKLLYSVDTSFKLIQHLGETIDTFYSFLSQRKNESTSFLIADELEKVRKITEYSFENSRIKLNFELDVNPLIQGNPNEFIHAILNLILNAKDAFDDTSYDSAAITLNVKGREKTCIITVSDNAGGIRLNPLEMIFDLHITTKPEGSGLGLYMTKNIIEKRFGGTIAVVNSNGGACFTIVLPYSQNSVNPFDPETSDEKLTLERIKQLTHKIIELEEMEKTLKKWAEIFEHAQWGIVIGTVEDQTFGVMNSAFARMHGYSVKELRGKKIASVFAPECIEDMQHAMQITHNKGYYSFESIHIRKDGSRFPVAIELIAVKDEQGNVQYRIANIWDITEKKAAEERLLLKRFALDHIKDAVFLIDENSMFHYVNEGACQSLGYSKEELLTMGVIHIDPNCPIEWWREHWKDIQEQGTTLVVTEYKRCDGTLYPIEVSSNYFEYDGVGYSLAISRDITERKSTEEALRQSEEAFRAMVENSPDVIMRYDLEGRRTYANPMAQILIGKPLEDILGKTPAEYSPLPVLKEFQQLFERVISEGKEYELESPYRTADGEIRFGSQRIVPEFDNEGKVAGVMVIGRDITERKNAEKQLKLLETAINHASDAVYILGDDRTVRYVSDTACRMLGYTQNELMGMKIEEIDVYLSVDKIDTMIEDLRMVNDMVFETKHRAKDGHILDVEINVTTFEYDGIPLKISIVKDISGRNVV